MIENNRHLIKLQIVNILDELFAQDIRNAAAVFGTKDMFPEERGVRLIELVKKINEQIKPLELTNLAYAADGLLTCFVIAPEEPNLIFPLVVRNGEFSMVVVKYENKQST